MQNLPEHVKTAGDVLGVVGWVTAITGLLTSVIGLFSALASLAWFCIRIAESKTYRKWRGYDAH